LGRNVVREAYERLFGASLPQAYLGNSENPVRNSSTARAHWRPSRIAQTTSDCPRRTSPAANTFGTDVA
jgi:hypothetical protein